ncbi:hypothetical protein L3Y34_004962 [Caenorhabditis briggsae]|uniref:MADF domain-containing protein n=1 Tax=Caenorhabditis briggsae TaxID=6238 RepID=A0AAE9ADA0_CAEBR|nr:hypothetical protein L3Y34_004962 [Caenorhabditis briggsae]
MAMTLLENYYLLLQEIRGQQPPNFDDTSRGVLLALIKERPTIWNSTAKLTKEDVLASFGQVAGFLSNMNPDFSMWAIIEKWCWVVESFYRCTLTTSPTEWRYNNVLDYLKPYCNPHYPYLGCLPKKRRNELTQLYADPEIIKVMEATEEYNFSEGLFRDEMHALAGDEQIDFGAMLSRLTVGQVVNSKRRGRPAKEKQRSPVDAFINLTPQSAQFQKLLEQANGSNFTALSFIEPADDGVDEFNFGFTPAMYSALIELVHEIPQIWAPKYVPKGSSQTREQHFEDIARRMVVKFNGTVDVVTTEKWTGSFMEGVYAKLREKFVNEEKSKTPSTWRYYEALKFTSTEHPMPALTLADVFIKSEDPSTSFSGFPSRATVASPAGSSQSEDSRMAASSPSAATQFGMSSNGNKSIKLVLENLVARSLKEEQGVNGGGLAGTIPVTDYAELKNMLEQGKLMNSENGPPAKRMRPEGSSSPPGSSRMIVYNDGRKGTQPFQPTATWVPPREDLLAKQPKEDLIATPPQKRAQATAVVKSGFPLEKQLRKIFQTGVPNMAGMIPVTSASLQRNGLITGLNGMGLQQSALQQALLKKMEPSTTMAASLPSMPSVSSSQLLQAQAMMNGTSSSTNGNATANGEVDDKWSLLGKLICTMAREVEARDPLSGCDLFKDLQAVMYKHSVESLRPRDNNSS